MVLVRILVGTFTRHPIIISTDPVRLPIPPRENGTSRGGGWKAKSYPIPSNTVSKLPSAANRVLKIVLHLIVLRPLIQDSGLFNSSLFCRPFIVNYSCEKKATLFQNKNNKFLGKELLGGNRRTTKVLLPCL